MEIQQSSLPDVFNGIQSALKPYTKKRKEISNIRRVLACYLASQVDEQQHLLRPLCLIEASQIKTPLHGARSLLHDYVHTVRNNIKAKSAYTDVLKGFGQHPRSRRDHVDLIAPKLEFLNVTRARHKFKRLKIIEAYFGMLGQTPAASRDHLDTRSALEDVESQLPVPTEILNLTNIGRSVGEELGDFVDRLEKCVLRARMSLKREQKLLDFIQSRNGERNIGRESQLQALGNTRNELILWIETELSRAGDSSTDHGETPTAPSQKLSGKGYLQSHLKSSKLHYSRYVLSRKYLILAVEETISSENFPGEENDTDLVLPKESSFSSSSSIPKLATYLGELLKISNDQKAMIQQKSHISVALAKLLKDAGQSLDRLADESHLLQVYPQSNINPSHTGLGAPISFGDEISNGEKPDLSHRARAWVFAVASAGAALKGCVSERLDEGGIALLEAQESLLMLLGFLGNDVEVAVDGPKEDLTDIWAVLDCKLGMF